MKIAIMSWLALLPLITYAQSENNSNITLSGVVIDAQTKTPLPGATIHLKNTTHDGVTNDKGEFNFLTGQKLPITFQLTYIGYKQAEITVNQRTNIVLALEAANTQLNDVVVVGYGTQQRKSLISSIAKVTAADVKDIPVAGVDAQLQGKAAGVQINSNTGVPGDGVFIRVRGATSINASNDPLYVVDGVFINNTSLQTVNTGGRATSPIADINPADIESIEVLKDASATAIYGSRGANGVVIITTKRGKYGSKPTINFNTSHGWAWAPQLWDLTTGPEHATIVNEFYRNSEQDAIAAGDQAGITKYAQLPFRSVASGGRGLPEEQKTYDRLGELFRTGALHNYNLSLQGGTQTNKYYLGAGYQQQEADIRPINFNRASLKFNFDQKIGDHVQVGTSNSIYRTYRNQARSGDGPQGGLLQSALHTPTYLPELNPDGTPARYAGFDNLQVLIDNYDVHSTSLRYIGNIYAEAELLPDLKFRTSWSLDYNHYDESEYWNNLTQLGAAPTNGLATSALTQNTTWINEQTLNYRKTFDGKHTLGVLLGNTLQSNIQSTTSAQGSGFPSNDFKLISAAATRTADQEWTKATLASFFGRIDYNYAGKYFVEVSARADGSSRFGQHHQFGYFPAIGGAWRLKEEPFLKNVNTISDLKLRASYGLTGNQNGIGNFAAQGLWSGGAGYPETSGSSDQAGIYPLQLSNPDLKWEKTSQVNVGVDLGLFNDRLGIEVNLYSKNTTDALLQLPVNAISGFNTYYANAGKVGNKGYEVAITSINVRNKHFTWQTNFNISGNSNKIKELPVPVTYYNRDWVRLQQGYSMYSFWLYKQLYVDPQTGNAVFEDVNKDGQITTADRQIMGSAIPKFFGGINNNFTYGPFDLGIAFSFQYGNDVYNLNRFFGEGGGTRDANRVLFADQLKRWQKPGDITDVPRVTAYGNNYTLEQSSRFLEDGSFLKLSSLSFGYNLPKSLISKAGFQNVRLYFIGSNLLILKKYSGPDPEINVTSLQNVQGLDLGTPPQPRTVQFGVNVTL
ncbi:TonB-dependent receptor [Chitinophaga agrisoli]|uniref:TonB-dependent receptor n=1 Tax=Chitinophaga agrisoli TaxID=2607653 RepID=A0A5B2VNU3_9BACT|nr:TonB-dependent receptor [Chitinophaga agrisoli]KAA2240781.1 TonB-dependent receptor [Chitinophaga agrisoli]